MSTPLRCTTATASLWRGIVNLLGTHTVRQSCDMAPLTERRTHTSPPASESGACNGLSPRARRSVFSPPIVLSPSTSDRVGIGSPPLSIDRSYRTDSRSGRRSRLLWPLEGKMRQDRLILGLGLRPCKSVNNAVPHHIGPSSVMLGDSLAPDHHTSRSNSASRSFRSKARRPILSLPCASRGQTSGGRSAESSTPLPSGSAR
jgi:hypothetical protein